MSEALIGLYKVIEVLWTTYVFIEFNSFAKLGIIKAVIALSSFLACMLINYISHKFKWGNLAIISIISLVLCWIISPFVMTLYGFIILSILKGFFEPLYLTPMSSVYYKEMSKRPHPLNQFALKYCYEKALAVPISALCLLIANPANTIVFVGSLMGLITFQIKPAEKISFENKNKNIYKNKR